MTHASDVKEAVSAARVIAAKAEHDVGQIRKRLEHAEKLLIETPDEEETIEISGLTPREKEQLALHMQGMNYKEVAYELNISPNTARVHRNNIMNKLTPEDRAKLWRHAIRTKVTMKPKD